MLFSSTTPVTMIGKLTTFSVLVPDQIRRSKTHKEKLISVPHESFTPSEITEEVFFSISNDFEIAIRTNSQFPDTVGEVAVDCGIEDFIEKFRAYLTLDNAGLLKGT